MKRSERTVLFALALLLAGTILALFFTRGWSDYREHFSQLKQASNISSESIDTQPLDNAQQLAPLAVTPLEQDYAQEALRLADHAVDLAFSAAMHDAIENPAPLTPQTRGLIARIKKAQASVAADQALVTQTTQEVAKASPGDKDRLEEELGVAQAQLSLDQDELEDAQQDLIRAGGDRQAIVQQLLDQHNASSTAQNPTQLPAGAHPAAPSPSSVGTPSIELMTSSSVAAQFQALYSLRSKKRLLLQAQQDALARAAQLANSHQELDKKLEDEKTAAQLIPRQTSAELRRLAEDQAALSDFDKRIEFEKQLASDYGTWIVLVNAREREFSHGLFLGGFWIFSITLLVLVTNYWIRRIFTGVTLERRQLHTFRAVVVFSLQAVGVLLILLVIFGMPSNLATVVALAGAGLTVALKDFIVGFFGWFVLMGKNGIRPGDWVEINGVGGEVIEVGLFHTLLLETGNWADAGHPTGRQVSFVNSFAIEGHYFNFSTSGQWLWDEIQVQVPDSAEPYVTAEAIQKIVADETAANGKLAEQEWNRVTPTYANRPFSPTPALSIRPAGSGVTVAVRYITRVSERHEVRARLYRAIVELLHRKQIPLPDAALSSVQPVADRR